MQDGRYLLTMAWLEVHVHRKRPCTWRTWGKWSGFSRQKITPLSPKSISLFRARLRKVLGSNWECQLALENSIPQLSNTISYPYEYIPPLPPEEPLPAGFSPLSKVPAVSPACTGLTSTIQPRHRPIQNMQP
ncbi:hypothetical protein ONS96_004230 [Cadophora gregata f. sp. sojae]|nr:hypothetical protein ONS96_004230 [Cadophora gregata f. sp. sojae]